MMCGVVTWEGCSRVLDLHVRMYVPPRCVVTVRSVRLTSGGYVRVCRHLGYLVGKKEQACAMHGIQGGES